MSAPGLAARGVPVAGIDTSEAMLEQLRAKPGADAIRAAQGDMAATRVEGAFSLVYLVFNTFFNLTTQDGQVACFANAAAHLPAPETAALGDALEAGLTGYTYLDDMLADGHREETRVDA